MAPAAAASPLPAAKPEASPAAAASPSPAAAAPQPTPAPRTGNDKDLILATTTSTQDSGLLDVLVPLFQQQTSRCCLADEVQRRDQQPTRGLTRPLNSMDAGRRQIQSKAKGSSMAAETVDEAKLHAFMGKVLGDLSGTFVSTLCSIGDRLGLFKDLSANGPATSSELAARSGVQERYAREWLRALSCAGYLEYTPADERYSLPPEHAMALANEDGPVFVGGMYQMLPAMMGVLDPLSDAFRKGGGVPQAVYHQSFWDGFERFSGGWFENLLIQEWLPAAPDLQAKLERGAEVADVGSGRGRALIKLAQAFPRSQFTRFDSYAPTIDLATAKAQAAGVQDRVRFVQQDVSDGLPARYDLITTFDVMHDMVNPRSALKAIRNGLKPDGTFLCLEINCADDPANNAGPVAAIFYGASITYCMTTSLAGGGEGLGTMGLPEAKLRELCTEAGYSGVRRLPLENPFNILYEVRP